MPAVMDNEIQKNGKTDTQRRGNHALVLEQGTAVREGIAGTLF